MALLCLSTKMAAAIALLPLFVMKNKPGCLTHRLRDFLSFTILMVFILRYCFFANPPCVLSFASFFLLSLSSSFSLPALPHYTKHIFYLSVLFIVLLQIVLSHLCLSFIPFVLSRSLPHFEGLLFAKCNPPILACHFNPPSCQPAG